MKKQKIDKKENRFSINFFEFSFLVEACIPPRSIARYSFWDDVINKYYHVLTDEERFSLYEWINKNGSMQYSLEKGNEDCELFNARFNPDNQYIVKTLYNDKKEDYNVFKWKDRYHTSKNSSILEQYITDIIKITNNN
ncbi:MAG: hypothetical protein ACYC6J_09450 [Coriobacteriia bacterium]